MQCDSYLRLARESLAQDENAPKGADLDSLMESDGDDDKTYAAMGVAKTISTESAPALRTLWNSCAEASCFLDRLFYRLFA